MRGALAAMQFLTRIPLRRFTPTAVDRARAPFWYGAVGLGLGAILAAAERLMRAWIPLEPRLVVVLVLNAALIGALHLDGLADTLDGLIGGSRGLAIMRDSRIGTFGVLGLLGALALQYSALVQLNAVDLTRALILAPGWGRAALVISAASTRPARSEGLGAAFISSVRLRHAVVSFATVLLAAVLLSGRMGIAMGAVAVGIAFGLAGCFRRRFGGQTGDTLGTVNVVVETAAYWLFLVRA